jgi:hypothetical protein
MEYKLVCPTYKRIETFKNKTYALLKKTNAPLPELWINEDEDLETYSQEFPELTIRKAGKTLVEKRNAIQDYYPIGTRIVFIDDDVKDIIIKENDKKRSLNDFNKMVEFCFTNAELHKSKIWGVYPIANPYFMNNIFRKKLCYIVGVMYGLINTRVSVYNNFAEDVERSCMYFKDQHLLFRIDFIAVVTKYYTEKGGLQETRTEEKNYHDKSAVVNKFPEYLKLTEKRGRAEVSYIRTKEVQNVVYTEALPF